MRLSVVSPFPPEISGIGQYGWNVVRGLARMRRFRSLQVLAPNGCLHGPADLAGEGVQLRRVWARDHLASTVRLARILRSERPDVAWFNLGFTVFGSSRAANFAGLMLPAVARRAGIRTVVTLHEIYEAVEPTALGAANGRVTGWGARAATRLLLEADLVCVTLGRYARVLETRYRADNVRHIPHGTFSTPEFLPRPPDAPPHDVLIFATFAPYKGLTILLEAMRHVRQRLPDATVTVAGSDHPRFPGYAAAVRASFNGASGLHWAGARPEAELTQLFARASVVVLPYTATTGSSSVLHRAAAAGRPVVASDLPDMRAVADEENLRVDYVPPGDAAALAEALADLLSDPARRAAMARHNLEAMRTMTLHHTCARYVELFQPPA